jgi:type I thyroxine 5'-deiodinase
LAQACIRDLGIEFPAVVDDFANSTEAAYTGWPDRLYVIDAKGTVAYKSAPGPYGFNPDGVEETLTKLLGQDSTATASPLHRQRAVYSGCFQVSL